MEKVISSTLLEVWQNCMNPRCYYYNVAIFALPTTLVFSCEHGQDIEMQFSKDPEAFAGNVKDALQCHICNSSDSSPSSPASPPWTVFWKMRVELRTEQNCGFDLCFHYFFLVGGRDPVRRISNLICSIFLVILDITS